MRQLDSTKAMFAANIVMFSFMVVSHLTGFRQPPPAEITVERINVVDSTGRLAMVIANAARLPGAMFEGKEYPRSFVGRGRSAGMLFFNEVGDEVGGLIYEGAPRDSQYRAFGHLSFDQWKQNQVVAIQYLDDGSSRSAGVRVWDRPSDPLEAQFEIAERMIGTTGRLRDSLNAERQRIRARVEGTSRLFLGSENKVAKLELRDGRGRIRIRLFVDSSGVGQLAFVDTTGRVTATFPPAPR